MTAKLLALPVLILALLTGGASTLSAAEPAPATGTIVTRLLTATALADYNAFIAQGEPAFRQLTPAQFDAVAVQLAPRLKAGYTVSFLGGLRKQGYDVTLWKVSFKDGGDDALATLSMKAGKVGGFYIR